MSLNPAQQQAVSTLAGPLLVLAGAGSGKTRVVTYRIAELIRHGTPPERILAVTFTNKAAREMQQRAAALLGGRLRQKPEISTFHSLCVRILRRHARRLGYPPEFVIYDRGEQEGLARRVLREIKVPDALLRPADLLAWIGRWKSAALRPAEAARRAETDRHHLAAAAYRRYQNALKAAGAVDFDDLLLLVEELFAQFEEVRRAEAARFDHILVDEYQDTNASQYRIVKALASGHRNLCVVGDDDQSIYGWRGAEVQHILHFPRDWPDAKIVRLEINYRSTQQILAWANRLIACNKDRHPKVLRATAQGPAPRILRFPDEEAEARGVVRDILGRLAASRCRPGDLAVLFRTNEQPRPFETEFRRARVPYVLVGGMSFYDRKEVRDVLAFLKLLWQPHDEVALLRVINTPPRGIGQAVLARLRQEALDAGRPLWDVLGQAAQRDHLPAAARQGIAAFRQTIEAYRAAATGRNLGELVRHLVADLHYRREIERHYPDPAEQQTRWAAVEEIANAAAAYAEQPDATLPGFLQEMTLTSFDDGRQKELERHPNAVALLTLHAAKGLEFDEVYLVGMEEGLLPHRKAIEAGGAAIDEERRLCYVGVTRAKRRLTLSLALARRRWGKPRPSNPSRFLYELTGQADNPNYLATIQSNPLQPPGNANPLEPRKDASRPESPGPPHRFKARPQ